MKRFTYVIVLALFLSLVMNSPPQHLLVASHVESKI